MSYADNMDDAGETPHVSIQSANTDGRVVVDASALPDGMTNSETDGDPQSEAEKGEPIAVTSGAYVETWLDFALSGTIPLDVRRVYRLGRRLNGPLGANRASLFDVSFEVDPDNRLTYYDECGRRVRFSRPFNLLASYNTRYRHLALRAPWLKQLELEDRRLRKHFRQGKDKVYRLIGIEDENGNRIDLVREAGLLVEAAHSDGYTLAFTNDGVGRRTSVYLKMNGASTRLVSYIYDAHGNMLEADCATAFKIRYTYDMQNRLISWRDRSGRTECRCEYDEQGRVIRTRTSGTWDGDRFVYEPESRCTFYHPGGGETVERSKYDENGCIVTETDGCGAMTRYDFDKAGYNTRIVDSESHAIIFAYDQAGSLKNRIDPEGRRSLRRGGAAGQPSISIDAAGGLRRFSYDAGGNLATVRCPIGNETRYDWTPAGCLAGIHRPDGLSEHRRYDAHHRLSAIVDAKGGIMRFWRDDPLGRVTAVTDALGQTTRYGYEDIEGKPLELPTSMTRADGATVRRRFDSEGRIAEVENSQGRVTRYGHGAFDRLTSVTDPEGGTVSYLYDVRGNVSTVTNALGSVYRYERDAASRVIAETDFDGRRIAYRRNSVGRIIEQRNADGSLILFDYDRSGLMIRRRAYAPSVDPDKGEAEEHETFTYDGRGSIVRAQNNAGVFTFERDKAGRISSEGANGLTVESRYDALGRRIERQIGSDLATYTFDPLGALSELTLQSGGKTRTIAFGRDALGRDVVREDGGFRLIQAFDEVGRLRRQSVAACPRSHGVGLERLYEWGEAGPVAVSDGVWGRSDYTYDGIGRVVEARHGQGLPAPHPDSDAGLLGLPGDLIEIERFSYNAEHAVTSSDTALPGERLDRALTPWCSTAGSRVRTARGSRGEQIALLYDKQGRVMERRIEHNSQPLKIWRFEWNALDRLVGCETPDGKRWRYAYDPFGRRVSKLNSEEATQTFLWDGDLIAWTSRGHLADGDGSSTAAIWHHDPNSDRPLAVQETNSTKVLNIVTDHLGTPRDLYDEFGECWWSRNHRVWGATRERPQGEDSNASVFCEIRFPGQWADDETGLSYNRFRYYDPDTAQYLSCDPIGLAGGLRHHGYVIQPMLVADPLGLSPKSVSQVDPSGIGNPNDTAGLTSVSADSILNEMSPAPGPTQLQPGSAFHPN